MDGFRAFGSMQVNDNGCTFCNEFNGRKELSYFEIMFGSKYGITERRIFETEHFACVPSLGSFVEGYLLVIPKQHFLAALSMPEAYIAELQSAIGAISSFTRGYYHKSFVMYEHGAASTEHAGGMSVVHAHLHFVPCSQNAISMCPEFSFLKFQDLFEAARYYSAHRDRPYLLLKDADDSLYFSAADDIPSQYFRKRVCDLCGIPGTGDWKAYPYIGNIRKTIQAAKDYKIRTLLEDRGKTNEV